MTITLRPHQHKAVAAMWDNNKGQVIIPTGGGKTICMIQDAIHQQAVPTGTTTVVVAPRILLAEQLCKEFLELVSTTHTHVMHVHSGDVEFFHTTNPEKIHLFANTCLLYTSPSPRDLSTSRMPSSA